MKGAKMIKGFEVGPKIVFTQLEKTKEKWPTN